MNKLELRERVSIYIRTLLFIAINGWALIAVGLAGDKSETAFKLIQIGIIFAAVSLGWLMVLVLDAKRARFYYYLIVPLDMALISMLMQYTGGLNSIFILALVAELSLFTMTFGMVSGLVYAIIGIVMLGVFNTKSLSELDYAAFTYKGLALMAFTASLGFYANYRWKETSAKDELITDMGEKGEKLERQVRELQAVSDVANMIHSTLDPDRLSALVVETLSRVFEMDTCALSIIDKKSGQTIFSAEKGLAVRKTDDETKAEFSTEFDMALGIRDQPFLRCLLLLDEEDVTAMLYTTEDVANRLQPADFQIMTAIATQILVAIENVRLYELTKKYSITDELTQLFNYRFLQQELRREVERSRRYTRPFSFIMIDVDLFKQYNDTYGHIKGDVVLSEIAMLLRRCCREIDKVARYGGEEFAIILAETDSLGAHIVAEKIRETIAAHLFLGKEGRRDANLTVSLGTASFPEHALDEEQLLRAADNALYLAKNKGRNRTCDPIAAPHETQ